MLQMAMVIMFADHMSPQVRHDVGNDTADAPAQAQGIVSKWRQKERLKTTAVALVLCLNIGVDPPDVIKISPCARLECWVDPLSMQPPKALETIGGLDQRVTMQMIRSRSRYLTIEHHMPPANVMSVSTAGKNLQAQYERWQGRAKYKTHLDPTMEDVKKLAISCRRTAKVARHDSAVAPSRVRLLEHTSAQNLRSTVASPSH